MDFEKNQRKAVDDDVALFYRGRRVDISKLPLEKEVRLPKPGLSIGRDFKETILGHLDGAIKQYRGPLGAHLREFKEYFTLHRDQVDPRVNPLGHLVKDASDDLAGAGLGLTCGFLAAKATYDNRKEVSDQALLESVLIGGFVVATTYFIGKWVTRRIQGK